MADTLTYPGLYRGYVIDNQDWVNAGDGKKLMRLKVCVPSVYGESISVDKLPWAVPRMEFVGPKWGLYHIPGKGERVWVEFEGGNAQFPVWGGHWIMSGDVPSEMYTNLAGQQEADIWSKNVVLKSHLGWAIKFSKEGVQIYCKPQTVEYSQNGEERPKVTPLSADYPKITLTDAASLGGPVLKLDLKNFDLNARGIYDFSQLTPPGGKGGSTATFSFETFKAQAKTVRLFGSNTNLPEYTGPGTESGTMSVGAIDKYSVGAKKGSCGNGAWGV